MIKINRLIIRLCGVTARPLDGWFHWWCGVVLATTARHATGAWGGHPPPITPGGTCCFPTPHPSKWYSRVREFIYTTCTLATPHQRPRVMFTRLMPKFIPGEMLWQN